MSQNDSGLRLENLEIKPHLITKLKGAGIESIFDLAISIPHQLIEDGGILTGADSQTALELILKAKKALIDSGLLVKDFSSATQRDCVFERMLCFSPFSIQGHFDQTPVCKDTQICNHKHKENRTHLIIRSMILRWEE
jgi:hypothetical protein